MLVTTARTAGARLCPITALASGVGVEWRAYKDQVLNMLPTKGMRFPVKVVLVWLQVVALLA